MTGLQEASRWAEFQRSEGAGSASREKGTYPKHMGESQVHAERGNGWTNGWRNERTKPTSPWESATSCFQSHLVVLVSSRLLGEPFDTQSPPYLHSMWL